MGRIVQARSRGAVQPMSASGKRGRRARQREAGDEQADSNRHQAVSKQHEHGVLVVAYQVTTGTLQCSHRTAPRGHGVYRRALDVYPLSGLFRREPTRSSMRGCSLPRRASIASRAGGCSSWPRADTDSSALHRVRTDQMTLDRAVDGSPTDGQIITRQGTADRRHSEPTRAPDHALGAVEELLPAAKRSATPTRWHVGSSPASRVSATSNPEREKR